LEEQAQHHDQARKEGELLRKSRENEAIILREHLDDAVLQEIEGSGVYRLRDSEGPQVLRLKNDREPFSSLTSMMDRDGLINAEGEYSIILEEDKLRVNGKKMPDDVHQKYLKLFERTQGYPVTGKTKIEISN
jgi:hypothetical protein